MQPSIFSRCPGDKGYISKKIYLKCKKNKINYVYHQSMSYRR